MLLWCFCVQSVGNLLDDHQSTFLSSFLKTVFIWKVVYVVTMLVT